MRKERQLAFRRRVDLNDLSDGWDQCYAVIRPASRLEYNEAMSEDVTKLSKEEQIDFELRFIEQHFIEGKVLVEDDNGATHLEDMEPEDVGLSMPFANKLYFEILGLKLDPKGFSTVVEPTKKPSNSESTTKTP